MEAKQALADKLKEANNILVTVSNNPSVDQLASCIGLTLALNKMNKHATAVFSGTVPSTIEFLQPEKTIEKNTDSLRDFIISLDKSKADKLRYKVEDKVVKIFITPYKTSISDKDLEFSQGDFNVDAVVALGVHSQNELDQAITAHGRILHDATVTTINVKPSGDLGAINWLEPKASSLSELIAELVIDGLGKDLLDEQMSTALLTGIVAETNRFSNDKTIPATMTLSAELMAAGANQQLVATKLEPPKPAAPPPPPPRQEQPAAPPQVTAPAAVPLKPEEPPKPDDGTLEIEHNTDISALEDKETPKEPELAQIHIDDQGGFRNLRDEPTKPEPPKGNTDPTKHMEAQHMIMEPPSMGGQLTSNTVPEEDEERPAGDPLNSPIPNGGLLQRSNPFSSPASATTAVPPLPPIDSVGPQGAGANPYPSPFDPAAPSMVPAPVPSTAQPMVVTPTAPAPQPAPAPASEPAPAPVVMSAAPAPAAPPMTLPQPPVVTPTVQPSAPAPTPMPAPAAPAGQTLSEIEQNVRSPHVAMPAPASAAQPALTIPPLPPAADLPQIPPPPASSTPTPDVDSARNAVLAAINAQPGAAPEPIQALNAQPLGNPLHDPQQPSQPAAPSDPNAPPPVPPPMIPPIQPS
jgi:hypothetical protein